MSLHAGSLCHRIIVESPTHTTKPSGQVVAISWDAITSRPLPASYKPVAGGESIRGRQVVATATAVFEIRWLSQLGTLDVSAETYRLRWVTGNPNPALAPVFEILKIEDPDGLRDSLMVQAKLVK